MSDKAEKDYNNRLAATILYGFRADGSVDILKRKDGE